MIVDANFTAGVSRHLSQWSENTTFTGDGLPSRKPLKLIKTQRTPEFNVLLIVFESLRRQNMQVYGYGRETTPFLNSLSIEEPGKFYVFRNAYTVSTTTMLAVPAILSGVAPEQPFRYYESFPLVWEYAEMMKYNTFFISSQSMQWYRFDNYYSVNRTDFYWNKDNSGLPLFNDGGVDDRLTTDKVNDHIAGLARKPFFGVIQFNTTHFPYKVPDEYLKWDESYIDKYDNSILFQDDMLRKIFFNLKKHNLLKNTVVIMVGDHGEAFKEHNSIGHIDTYNSETAAIPLMIYVPEGISPKINLSQLKYNTELNTSNADIVPTIINLLGLRKDRQISSIYPDFTGRNLLEAFDKDRNIITLNSSELMSFNSGVSLIKGDYHYILRTNLIPYTREFYNTKTDPLEVHNLIKNTGQELLEPLHNVLKKNPNTEKIYNQFYP
jgi:glucan phosphoethanolaminetransferase (alkaline phosphatase superfamily)